jgi:hypothetical protein
MYSDRPFSATWVVLLPGLIVAVGWLALAPSPIPTSQPRRPAADTRATQVDLGSALQTLKHDRDAERRTEAATELSHVRGEPARTDALSALIDAVGEDRSRTVREYACTAITELYRPGDDPRRLLGIVADPRAPGRLQALRALSRLGEPLAYDSLLRVSRSPDREARMLALSGLSRFPSELTALDRLLEAVREQESGIRITAMIGLESVLPKTWESLPLPQKKTVFDSLAVNLGDSLSSVRSGSARLLARILATELKFHSVENETARRLAECLKVSAGQKLSEGAGLDLFLRYSLDVVGFSGLPVLSSQGAASKELTPTPTWNRNEIEEIRKLGTEVFAMNRVYT